MFKRRHRSIHQRRKLQSGAVVLELLLVTPINMIVLLAVVQFALFSSNSEQLVLGCRVGAEMAAQTGSLPDQGTIAGDPVPTDIANVVLRQLRSSGIDPCAVILEHNIRGPEQTLRTNYTAASTTCAEPTSPIPVNSTRLTICVPLTELMPNCLSAFGFDIANRTLECSTTFGYEL